MTIVEDATGLPELESHADSGHRSPGQHKKHYSPKTRVVLVTGGRLPQEGRGAYLSSAVDASENSITQCMPANPGDYARKLYKALHELDGKNLDWIAIELPPSTLEWAGIRDRLTRAAY
jgi:L-threonylcarbamoyladenylate synthase